MNNAARIAEIVLPVVVSLFLGWLSRLKNILSRAQIDGLKTCLLYTSLSEALEEAGEGVFALKKELRLPCETALETR